jgi:hypothetical protein
MKFSHRKGFIDRQSYVAQYLALVFLTMGIASAIGTDDLLAAFAAGPYYVSHLLITPLIYIIPSQAVPSLGTVTSTSRPRTICSLP